MQPQGTSLLYFSYSLCAQPVEADSGLIKSTSLAVRVCHRGLGFVDLSPIPYPFDASSPMGWVHKPSRLIKWRFN
jgi:hypothetical protein